MIVYDCVRGNMAMGGVVVVARGGHAGHSATSAGATSVPATFKTTFPTKTTLYYELQSK